MKAPLEYSNPKSEYETPVRWWQYLRDVAVTGVFVAAVALLFRRVLLGSLAKALFDWDFHSGGVR
jgi:hypothetical protein